MAIEKRLIDANDFHDYLEGIRQDYLEEDALSSNFAAEVIETVQDEYLANTPTVDAVEVVRCKECVSFEERGRTTREMADKVYCWGYCYHWDYEQGMSPNQVDGDDFCSYGERRTDGTESEA